MELFHNLLKIAQLFGKMRFIPIVIIHFNNLAIIPIWRMTWFIIWIGLYSLYSRICFIKFVWNNKLFLNTIDELRYFHNKGLVPSFWMLFVKFGWYLPSAFKKKSNI